jgi:CheY-like chemotaxis protein
MKTILVTDDDGEMLDLVAIALEEHGYRVETATNGREALDRVSQKMPDLILLDMKMPFMSGWEFAKEYGDTYEAGAAPVVVMTAAEHAAMRAQEIGAREVLAKPFSLDELVLKVARCLGESVPPPTPEG